RVGAALPREVVNERSPASCTAAGWGMASRRFLNMDHVMWECDYPHSDSTWPFAPEELAEHLDGVSDEEGDKISHLNAMRHFRYDPFTVRGGREECTVGALRARAAGHDVAIRSVNPDKVGHHATRSVDLATPGS